LSLSVWRTFLSLPVNEIKLDVLSLTASYFAALQLHQWLSLTILNSAKFLLSLTEIAVGLGTVTVGDFDGE